MLHLGKEGGKDVSARVSPVVLARGGGRGEPSLPHGRPHNCSYGELPRRRTLEGGMRGSSRFRVALSAWSPGDFRPVVQHAGTSCRPRGTAVALGLLEWPFALRPYLQVGTLHEADAPCQDHGWASAARPQTSLRWHGLLHQACTDEGPAAILRLAQTKRGREPGRMQGRPAIG